MARIARIVVPNVPHHVTQRGNRRQTVFFGDSDYQDYLALLKEFTAKAGVDVLAWCLMPNHVHLLLIPPEPGSLRAALAEVHRRYSRHINLREDWRGYLWQGRFASCPTDEAHTIAAARYVELNPVRAQLVAQPIDWPWSSARAHLTGRDDGLTKIEALGLSSAAWTDILQSALEAPLLDEIRAAERTGRPLGDERFIRAVEHATGRLLMPGKRGPKAKPNSSADPDVI
jgi:putative transposase